MADTKTQTLSLPRVDALILAGGQSRRMGVDKAWMDWRGQPLIEHIAQLARRQHFIQPHRIWISCAEHNVARAQSHFRHTLLDASPFRGQGPLAGVHAGLSSTTCEWLWVLPCDAIDFPGDLLYRMVTRASSSPSIDAVILSTTEVAAPPRMHPVWALISRTALPMLTTCLETQSLRVMSFFERINTVILPLAPNEKLWNINRPGDLPALGQ